MRTIARVGAVVALAAGLAWSGTAMAFGGHGGGFHGGGFHGGGFHGGFHGGGFHGGFHGGYWGGYWGGYYPGWWGDDYYDYPDYWDYPYDYGYSYPPPYSYPPGVAYEGPYAPMPHGKSRYCATQRRICVLRHSGRVGAPCTCRVTGGVAHGRIAPQ